MGQVIKLSSHPKYLHHFYDVFEDRMTEEELYFKRSPLSYINKSVEQVKCKSYNEEDLNDEQLTIEQIEHLLYENDLMMFNAEEYLSAHRQPEDFEGDQTIAGS